MKDKTTAGILAIVLGSLGVHRFYLGQIGVGILYIFCCFGLFGLLGILDAIILFTMDKQDFDFKYNRNHVEILPRNTDFNRQRREQADFKRRKQTPTPPVVQEKTRQKPPIPRNRPLADAAAYKEKGKDFFQDYDYPAAIEMYHKVLEINEKDIAVHFNLACAYSLTENAKKAYYHLERALAYGFKDKELIHSKDHLAWLRIHPDFEAFVKNNYRKLPPPPKKEKKHKEAPKSDKEDTSPDLLEQLNRLQALRDKGFLTEAEFLAEKERLGR